MNIAGLLFLIITQFLAGRGVMAIFGIKQKPVITFAISSFIGVGIFSMIPLFVELFGLKITKTNIGVSICAISALLNIAFVRKYDYGIFRKIKFSFPKLYELVFIIFFVIIMIPSLWLSYFYPPQARDVLSGPEPLAEFAIKEGTLNNSVFTMNLEESVPNLLKPPFVTNLQIVYKYFVHSFGQVYLSIMVLCFLVWIYYLLREKLHPVVAGFLMLFFMTIPEMYAYTFILLWDYCNTIYFVAGIYFLIQYLDSGNYKEFLFSALMFGFATFVRVETLIFIGLLSPILITGYKKGDVKLPKLAMNFFLLALIPFAFYFIWVNIFVKYKLPLNLDDDQKLNLGSEVSYADWFSTINSELMFGGMNYALYGYFIYFFILVVLIDAIFFRSFNKEAKFWLAGVLVVYLGMPLLIYATVYFNITTAKRGFFKMFPLMILYMRNSPLFTKLSNALIKFEMPEITKEKEPRPVLQPVKQHGGKGKRK